ncbi:response regulator [Chondromyces crocatus]|uniref:Chemotaxis protein CheY n=1 Tax=Chondromyces crocatus TaxID=52 RepID=A0A0K1EIG9_CHOCO|nr:response regulator [Chondromyces crocatus]AKT40656.1 chemotaxis protein CheY [Chondromyces crocatus]
MKGVRQDDQPSATPGADGAHQARQPILVVDDDIEIREMLRIALSEEGYGVLCASDGAAALHLLDQEVPGLILLDMRMPVMDGWAFARAYAARPGPHAPILVITAAVDAGRWAREIGASAAIAKPFDLNRLIEAVAEHMSQPALS